MTTLTYPSDRITITDRSVMPADLWGKPGKHTLPIVRSGVIVADAQRCECRGGLHEQGRCAAAWFVMPGEATYPPADLVALTEPCQTCDGHGSYYPMQRGWGKAKQKPCPDCRGGKPTFTLVEESTDASGHYHSKAHLGDGWTITDLLPIQDQDHTTGPRQIVPSDTMEDTSKWWLWNDNGPNSTIILPAAARPGMWAALCEQETT